MVINLTGLLDDGTPPRPGVQTDPRQTISFPRGSDVAIIATILTPGGALADLSGVGTTLQLTISKYDWQYPPYIVKLASIVGNIGTFTIAAADTKYLSAGQYNYDVWLTLGGKRDAVIPLSMMMLTQSVASVSP